MAEYTLRETRWPSIGSTRGRLASTKTRLLGVMPSQQLETGSDLRPWHRRGRLVGGKSCSCLRRNRAARSVPATTCRPLQAETLRSTEECDLGVRVHLEQVAFMLQEPAYFNKHDPPSFLSGSINVRFL